MSKAKLGEIIPAKVVVGNRALWIILSMIAIITLMLRVVYPFKFVFGSGFVNFLETDAWNRMMYAKQIAGMSFFDSISYMVQNNLLFSWIVGTLGRVFPIEVVGAWLPPLIAVGVVITVFFIGRALFNIQVGLLAAIFVSVIPSEFLHRSLLGFADHHALEVLLMTLVILFLILAFKKGKAISWYSVLAGVSLALYFINWKSGIYMLTVMLGVVVLALVAHNFYYRRKFYDSVPVLVIPALIALAVYLPIGGYRQLLFLLPGDNLGVVGSQAVQATGEIASTLFEPVSRRTISELMPLFEPYGRFDLRVIITNLHLFAVAFLIGLVFLWKRYRQDKVMVLMAVWTIAMLALTINERRFLYYLTLNIGILAALAVVEVAKFTKGNILQGAVILALPLLIISLPLAKGMGASQPYRMTEEWHIALMWLKDQPENSTVSAWGDYGHWIQYVSGKTPSYMPGPGGSRIAKLFFSEDAETAKKLLNEMDTAYLIVDELTLKGKFGALVINAGFTPVDRNRTLAYQLYFQNKVTDFLLLEYQTASIKIYRYLR